MKHCSETRREYADLLSSMMLCRHFNPKDDKALRKTLKYVKMRVKSDNVKKICQIVIKTTKVTPSDWLTEKIKEVEYMMTMKDFLFFARQEVIAQK